MKPAFRNPATLFLLGLWSLAIAAAICLHSKHSTDLEAFTLQAEQAFAQEAKLVGMLVERNRVQLDKALPPNMGGTAEYILIDAQGAVLADSHLDAKAGWSDEGLDREIQDQLSQLPPTGEVRTRLDKTRLLGALALSRRSQDEAPLLLIAIDDIAPRLSPLARAYQVALIILAALTVLLSIAIGLTFLRDVSRPLARIRQTIARFGSGDASARTGLTEDNAASELGRLFDDMAEHIAAERRHLSESEERLKFALHGSNAGIWDWEIDSGHIYYSPRWKALLGFADDELLAHAEEWLKRVHPDDLPRVMELLDAHLNGLSEFFESEHRLRRKDNTYLWVLERGLAIRPDGRARRMVGALTDISRRKEVETALQRNEEAYRSVVEGVTQIIFRADGQGRFTFLNPAWAELTGFPINASLEHPLLDFVLADDRGAISNALGTLHDEESTTAEGEFRLLSHSNEARWFSLHARALHEPDGTAGIAGVLTDIDAQKSAQHALDLSNTKRKAVLDLSPDGFVFIDRRGRVEYVNPAFLAMTGLDATALEGLRLSELESRMSDLCAAQSPLPHFDAANDGRERLMTLQRPGKMILKWQLRTIEDELGAPQISVLYFRDVTRETEIDRMKTEFLSTAAHELRTPMASIFGFSELLLARQYDAATQRDLIQTIHRQTKNLIDLVNELLDLARIEARGGKSFKIEENELAPIVLGAVSAMYLPSDTHRMEVSLPEDLPLVRIDADKFRQCMANVLSNAYKYSPGGGTIRVSAKRRDLRNQEQVGISVTDTGLGMTPEQVSHIFDRFYRANSSSGIPGTGLGMSLVKEIMNIFGGEVSVDSTPGQGTEVTLWLKAIRPGKE